MKNSDAGSGNTVLIILAAIIVIVFFVLVATVTAKIHHRGHFLPHCDTKHTVLCDHHPANTST